MEKIVSVTVTLDQNVPEAMAGIIRCGSVISEDKNGNTVKDHHELIDNKEYHSKEELISDIAKRLKVSTSIIHIEA
ncbi:MAG: hypothetical protein HQM11_02970 [SAR324 cluster bacterium]|nr:hypothetical protein [SAR324 cluster bacterium]